MYAPALFGGGKCSKDMQESCLACAARPHDSGYAAVGNIKVDALENLQFPEAFVYVPCLNHSPQVY